MQTFIRCIMFIQNAEHSYSHIHEPLRVSCNNRTMSLEKLFEIHLLNNIKS